MPSGLCRITCSYNKALVENLLSHCCGTLTMISQFVNDQKQNVPLTNDFLDFFSQHRLSHRCDKVLLSLLSFFQISYEPFEYVFVTHICAWKFCHIYDKALLVLQLVLDYGATIHVF